MEQERFSPRFLAQERAKLLRPKYPKATEEKPTMEYLEQLTLLEYIAEATDGCTIEMDAEMCIHGHANWLRYLNLI